MRYKDKLCRGQMQEIKPIIHYFSVILENFRQCFIQMTLRELPVFEVMTWQLCHLQCSASLCLFG